MILYTDQKTNERLYDTSMIRETFDLQISFLKREMGKYNFKENDFIKYKNIHLYREQSVIDFVENLVQKRLNEDVSKLKRRVEKIKGMNGSKQTQ